MFYNISINKQGVKKKADLYSTSSVNSEERLLNELMAEIYMKPSSVPHECLSTWNLLMLRAANDEGLKILRYLVSGVIKDYFDNENEFKRKLCTNDKERIEFESLFESFTLQTIDLDLDRDVLRLS